MASAFDGIADKVKARDRLAVVSASLGSTVAFNTMLKLINSTPIQGTRPGKNTQERLSDLLTKKDDDPELRGRRQPKIAFYMFANQYGMLMAGKEPQRKGALEALEKTVVKAQTEEAKVKDLPVPVMAFTDPDDLLSMPLPKPADPERVMVRNVYVTNNRFGLVIPSFGRVTNPLAAHQGYGTNPKVLEFMLAGRF
jgi:hypothetical protein